MTKKTVNLENGQLDLVRTYLNRVILGKPDVIDKLLIAFLANGHLLIEDVPGVGKTTMAHGLAQALDCLFRRISFTSDMMPSDILGVSIFNRNRNEFEFQPGPIFTNILLADELNRTTPKTQSAFLEAMESGKVTIDKTTYDLPHPFMVLATQNPLEFTGTFPLPVSQLDRFLMRVSIGYPDQEHEEKILNQYRHGNIVPECFDVLTLERACEYQQQVTKVYVEPCLVQYLGELAAASRKHQALRLGVSPRGTLALQRAAQARAFLGGRDFVLPDDIQDLLVSVWGHRIVIQGTGPSSSPQDTASILEEILSMVAVPV